jgi:DNA-binding response OmpR family regulator
MMAEAIRTLVVDDEEGIRSTLKEALQRSGHVVATASDGEEALDLLRETAFDAAVLDLNLGSRVDGLRLLEAIRWRWPRMAVVILTAHGSLESAITAIREGADDYLLKPVKPSEVCYVVGEVLRKRQQRVATALSPDLLHDPSHLRRGDFTIDFESRRVELGGQPLDLTAYEYELLVYLMENDDRPVPPPELVKVVRGYECDHLQEARDIIKWYVYRLRIKVEPKPSTPRHILNVRGAGYIFKA